jgi:FKBP-type peptidyl-prolyl cis-trans isomerase
MSVGENAIITCPPDYAYGSSDVGNGLIPANSTLVFDVELIKIN